MESLLQKIRKNWEMYQLSVFKTKPKYKKSIKIPVKLIVCVSGGCDSVSLLHLLQRLSSLMLLQLHVLHFNHKLRPEADNEQNFVKHVRIFTVSFSKFHSLFVMFVQIPPITTKHFRKFSKFVDNDQHLLDSQIS